MKQVDYIDSMTLENEVKSESPTDALENIDRVDDKKFHKKIEQIIKDSEEMRLNRMRQHRTRNFISMNLSILSGIVGVFGFGWFFLMEAQIVPAFLALGVSFIPTIFLGFWVRGPIKTYTKEHKTVFMPKLAKTLNGLSFYPERGVSERIIKKLGVMPSFDRYHAEDCFVGKYKGVKVIFSEARLYGKGGKNNSLFDGIFVLLETPSEVIEGHTIITANDRMVQAYAGKRWKNMEKVHIAVSNPEWDKFHVYSTKPDVAELMVGDRLIKELAEAAEIFDEAPMTAVLFGKKYIFMMIPYAQDMFEASDMFVPVTTKSQALRCKKEIEQLLEIIDVFDLYKPAKPI